MPIYEIVLIIVGTLLVLAIGFVAFLPWIFGRFVRLVLLPRYGFRIRGREHIPKRGAGILAVNHVTWIDALFVAAACPRGGRVLANAGFFTFKPLHFLVSRAGMIPVPFSGPKAQRAAIVAVRDALDRGELVAIFPEGQLTRNGMLGPFYRGLEVILKGRSDVPVIPVYLDGLWGSIWSFQGWRAFGKRPVGLRRVVNVAFGPALTGPPSLFEVRLAILDAGVDAVGLRKTPPAALETIDPSLDRFDHPSLGSITGSAPDYDRDGVVQPGRREGTVGLSLPGVALRVVDGSGRIASEEVDGRVEVRNPLHPQWTDTGATGHLDRDGFLTVRNPPTEGGLI
jgi:1-acyl-sn-glycerol-3-phosphate acyltransferase